MCPVQLRSYLDLDLPGILAMARRIYGEIIDCYITGSYAYSKAHEGSDIDCLVTVNRYTELYRGKNWVDTFNGVKIVFYEIPHAVVHNYIWLGKFDIPKYGIVEGIFYPGKTEDVEKWIEEKRVRDEFRRNQSG